MARTAPSMSVAQLLDLRARTASAPSLATMRDKPVEKSTRGQKYSNQKVTDQGITFDSKAEHRRWCYLRLLERAGEIKDLRRQVSFMLIPELVKPRGGKERPTHYIADFVYLDKAGAQVVEDVKGAVTPEFRLKRKLMLWAHGIEVQEVRS